MDPAVTSLGGRVRECREQRGWTQKELAGAASISVTFLSELENDHRTPGAAVVLRLSDALGVTLNYLLRGAVSERPKRRRVVLPWNSPRLPRRKGGRCGFGVTFWPIGIWWWPDEHGPGPPSTVSTRSRRKIGVSCTIGSRSRRFHELREAACGSKMTRQCINSPVTSVFRAGGSADQDPRLRLRSRPADSHRFAGRGDRSRVAPTRVGGQVPVADRVPQRGLRH